MSRFVVREKAWPLGSPMSWRVVRVIGLKDEERRVFRKMFGLWVDKQNQETGQESPCFPCWYEYKERPTWFDVRVRGEKKDMHVNRVVMGVREILRMMQ
jgi:hypothetical protein